MWGRDFRVTLLRQISTAETTFLKSLEQFYVPHQNEKLNKKQNDQHTNVSSPHLRSEIWHCQWEAPWTQSIRPSPRQQLLTAPARLLNRDSSHWGHRRNPTSHPRGYAYLRISFFTSRSSSSWSFWMKLLRTGISNFIYWATWGGKSKSGVQDPSQHYSNFFWHLSHIRHKALGNLFLH